MAHCISSNIDIHVHVCLQPCKLGIGKNLKNFPITVVSIRFKEFYKPLQGRLWGFFVYINGMFTLQTLQVYVHESVVCKRLIIVHSFLMKTTLHYNLLSDQIHKCKVVVYLYML